MNRSPRRAIAIDHRRATSAARMGPFALPFLALLFATFESAFVTIAQQAASVARLVAQSP